MVSFSASLLLWLWIDIRKKEGQNRSSVLGGSMSPGDLSGRDAKVPAGPWAMNRRETSKAFKAKLFHWP